MLRLGAFLSFCGTVLQWIEEPIIQFINGNTAVVMVNWTAGLVDLL